MILVTTMLLFNLNRNKFEKYRDYYKKMKIVEKGFSYNSGNNPEFLDICELRKLIKDNVDSNFKPI